VLNDQSQLAKVYLHAWQVTGNEYFRTITEEILDYVIREMRDPAGGFYSTQDADSEGEEGKFFAWAPDEISGVLGAEADAFIAAYGATRHGNFEAPAPGGLGGKNILEFVSDMDRRPALAQARRELFEAREKRVHPGRDEKVLTSWNGLMLAAFAEAARILGRDDHREVAERSADFLLCELRQGNGRLLRTWKRRPEPVLERPAEGAREAKLNACLEDYSYLIDALLELYQTTFEPRWYLAAHEQTESMLAHFQAPGGGFYDTSDDHEALITKPRDMQDNATPSGNAMAVTALLKIAGLSYETRYVDLAHEALTQIQPMMTQSPCGFGQWLAALSYALSRPREIVIIGQLEAPDTAALLRLAQDGYQHYQIVAVGAPDAEMTLPAFQDRDQIGDRATAYVCANFACQAPVADVDELRALFGRKEAGSRASDGL
jgi:hypothetical protein